MSKLEALRVLGTGICSPDRSIFEHYGLSAVQADKSLLPVNIRRRTGLTTQIAITAAIRACEAAQVEIAHLPSVFASVGGEIQVTDELCRMLPDQKALLSPTQFHNSVHNTTAGYWSVVSGSRKPTIAVAAEYDTFAMGLLEAWIQTQYIVGPLLLVCYDEVWPQYLAPPIGRISVACALVLSIDGVGNTGVKITLPRHCGTAATYPQGLEAIIRQAPAAAAIPLLQAIQRGASCENIPLSLVDNLWVTNCVDGVI